MAGINSVNSLSTPNGSWVVATNHHSVAVWETGTGTDLDGAVCQREPVNTPAGTSDLLANCSRSNRPPQIGPGRGPRPAAGASSIMARRRRSRSASAAALLPHDNNSGVSNRNSVARIGLTVLCYEYNLLR